MPIRRIEPKGSPHLIATNEVLGKKAPEVLYRYTSFAGLKGM
jgi:hypothetical protein